MESGGKAACHAVINLREGSRERRDNLLEVNHVL